MHHDSYALEKVDDKITQTRQGRQKLTKGGVAIDRIITGL